MVVDKDWFPSSMDYVEDRRGWRLWPRCIQQPNGTQKRQFARFEFSFLVPETGIYWFRAEKPVGAVRLV